MNDEGYGAWHPLLSHEREEEDRESSEEDIHSSTRIEKEQSGRRKCIYEYIKPHPLHLCTVGTLICEKRKRKRDK